MAEKMRGVIAQLLTVDKDGKRIDSKIVFRPYCDWYIKSLHDTLAETEFTDPGSLFEEFGQQVAEAVFNGQIVEVERIPHEDLELRECRKVFRFIRVKYPLHGGQQDDLMNESTARKLGYLGP